jgi:hypothetical protein
MIKLIEIYEDETAESRDYHSGEDFYGGPKLKTRYNLREVFLNPEYITLMRCDASYQQKLSRGLLVIEGGKKLNSMQKFTKVNYVSGNAAREIVAVISVEELVNRVNGNKSLLRG